MTSPDLAALNKNALDIVEAIGREAVDVYATKSWDEKFHENKVKAGLLKQNAANLVLQAGMSGKPLDFSWLS
jgi:hypothetical protein